MSNPQIPVEELSEIEFSSDPPTVSFAHQGQKYWLYIGSDSKDLNSALSLYSQLKHSSSVTVYDSGNNANGYHILKGVALTSHPRNVELGSLTFNGIQVFTLFLLLLIVLRLYWPRKKAEQGAAANP